jgi:CRISPR/Cas system-associated endonuclease Cas1
LTQKGRPVAVLRTLDDDCYIQTRISQYEASKSDKAAVIAMQFVCSKILGQDQVLSKYGLKRTASAFWRRLRALTLPTCRASEPGSCRLKATTQKAISPKFSVSCPNL